MITQELNEKTFSNFRGLSTDTKPTDVENGATFLEMDTSKVFIFNGATSTWVEL